MNRFGVLITALFVLAIFGSANAAITVVVVSPTDVNYTKDTTLAIVFTVVDSNDERNDYNANIYYGTEQGTQTNLIVNDLNLAEGVEDGAAVNCNGTDTDFSTAARTCYYNWDTTGIADANYYIDVNVFAMLANCADGNACIRDDTNADSGTFVLDKTAPTGITFTIPDHIKAPGENISWTATEATSAIVKYWVSTDDGVTYVDNGATANYDVSCAPGHVSTLYVKATDHADNNSSATSTNVSCESAGGPPICGDGSCDSDTIGESAATCPVDCGPVCGDGACTHTESAETCALDCFGCGDGICSGNEDCSNCEQDCGECEDEPPVDEPPVDEPPVDEPPIGPEVACNVDSDCGTDNVCTTGSCVSGNCSVVPKADGTSCGYAKECISAVCTDVAITQAQQDAELTNYVIAGVAIVVVAAAYFFFTRAK